VSIIVIHDTYLELARLHHVEGDVVPGQEGHQGVGDLAGGLLGEGVIK
jgi:hypothetical protein